MLQLDNLEFLALEGGGAKGAVYKGAILALEKIFYEKSADTNLHENGESLNISLRNSNKRKIYPSILSYRKRDTNELKIKGIAGASAGAINAFTLALGLTATDIDYILNNFPFTEFLSQIDSGKYRMVSSKSLQSRESISADNPSNVYIGEDKSKKKLGKGDGTKEYYFKKDKVIKVGDSLLKGTIRWSLLALVLKIIITGAIESIHEFLNIWRKTEGGPAGNQKISPNDDVYRLFDMLGFLKKKNLSLVSIAAVDNFITWLLKKVLSKKAPMLKLVSVRSIANYLFDGGLYSGFMVREFFLNCLLYSLSKDIYCKQNWIKFIANPESFADKKPVDEKSADEKIEEDSAQKEELEKKYKVVEKKIKSIQVDFTQPNGRFRDSDFTEEEINRVYKITFRQFNKITGLNFIVCSTNLTTSEPMYFSHEWTPDFPVLEAVGMSMTIPPAIKPVYNEANVIFQEEELTTFTSSDNKEVTIVDKEGNFNEENHYRLIMEVMKKVKKEIEAAAQFTINTTLSFSNYLPHIKNLIDFETDPLKKSMYTYVYNSAFKGQYFDGGVTNNIPYNAFRIKENANIDKTLALKVDNNYPLEEQEQLLTLYRKYNRHLNKVLESLSSVEDVDAALDTFYTLYYKVFSMLFTKFHPLFAEKMDKPAFAKTISTLRDIEKKITDNNKPWEKRTFALTGLLDGLMYGFDKGQVRSLNDNNHIIPLYCYGIGTYDFDLESLKFLTGFANLKSEESVWKNLGVNSEGTF